MKILYNFASRSRPEKLISCISNIIYFSSTDEYVILVKLDVDDIATNNRSFFDRLKSFGSNIVISFGFSDNKIHAINRDIHLVKGWDILINMSDDIEFISKGFDVDIINEFYKVGLRINEPGFTDLFLHYPDGSPAGDVLSTVSIMGRSFYDRFSYVYHPSYMNVYADNEATAVAKILGKYIFVNERKFSHNHPVWNLAEWDDQYRRCEDKENYRIDGHKFNERQKINFDL